MSAIQQNRWDQLLRRAADLKGPGSKVNDALTELFPTFDVEKVPAELYKLGGIDICFGGSTVTGAAGQNGRLQLFNPAGSGKLVTCTSFTVSLSGTGIIRYGTVTGPFTSAATQLFRDTRGPFAELPTAFIGTRSEVGFGPANGQFRLLANTPYTMDSRNSMAVLAPGTGIEVGPNILAAAMNVTFFWRERVAEPSELNL